MAIHVPGIWKTKWFALLVLKERPVASLSLTAMVDMFYCISGFFRCQNKQKLHGEALNYRK